MHIPWSEVNTTMVLSNKFKCFNSAISRHGFDHWVAYGTYDNHLRPMYWENTAPRDSFFYVNKWGPEYEVDRAIEFLSKQKESSSPFALVVSMNPPHTGYDLVFYSSCD